MAYLIREYVTPPSGWRYVQPETSYLITAANLDALQRAVIAYRNANNLPVGSDIRGEIETQICYGLTAEWCDSSPPTPTPAPTPDSDEEAESDLLLEDYGAAIDGVTDDAVAWVNALADAKLLKRNIRWIGTSRIAAELPWPNLGSDMGLKGYGMGQSVLLCDFGGDPSTACGIKFNPAAATSNIVLRDFTIRGAADDDTAIYELISVVDRIYDLRIERVEFAYARHAGFRISTAGNAGKRITVKHCLFRDIIDSNMSLTAGAAILTTGYSDVEFIGNKFRNCGEGNFSHAIYTQQADGLKIAQNDFDGANSRLHLTGTANTNVQVGPLNSFRGQVRHFVSGTGVRVFGNNFWDTTLRLNDIIGVHVIGNFFQTAAVQDFIDTIGTPEHVTIEDNDFVYTGATRTSLGNGFCSDLNVTDLLLVNNRCRHSKLCKVGAAVRPVVRNNYLFTDAVNMAVGLIEFNSAASIDTVKILENYINGTNLVSGRAIEVNSMADSAIQCEDNIILGGLTVVGCVNEGWSKQNSKLCYTFSNAGITTYIKLSLDGSDATWEQNTTPP